MELTSEFKEELRQAMNRVFQQPAGQKPADGNAQSLVTDFKRNLTGADTIIFAFDYQYTPFQQDSPTTIPLILRIYGRNSQEDGFRRAEWELQVLQHLKSANVAVPEAFYAGKSVINRAYVVMERIDGVMQSTLMLEANKHADMALIGQLFHQFVASMVKIHSVDLHSMQWSKLGEDLTQTSRTSSARLLAGHERMHQRFNLNELKPIVDWLKHRLQAVSDEPVVLVHGDYHPANIIISAENEAFILDWADITVGDYRMDLGFAIGLLKGNGIDVTEVLVGLYQTYSGKTVQDLDFFILLAHYKNFLRIYSMINNFAITGENEASKKAMLGNYVVYSQYLLDLVVTTTGIDVPSVNSHFGRQ